MFPVLSNFLFSLVFLNLGEKILSHISATCLFKLSDQPVNKASDK